jgi:hypothetical protein
MTRIVLNLDRVEADRLIIALDRNAAVGELAAARRLAAAARDGAIPADGVALARRCLHAEGNAPALLARLSSIRDHGGRSRRRPRARVYD